jgi:DNA modification methylase
VNKVSEFADWDDEMLRVELDELGKDGFDLELTGFSLDEIADLQIEEVPEGLTDEDAVPEAPDEPVTVEGDVWVLGNHRLHCGDSTSIDAVEKLMDGQRATLLHADPPYGMGKEGEGVVNDNLYQDKLDAFQMEWWTTFRCVLEDNASAYIWGNAPDLWRLWYNGGLSGSERMTMRNQIVWDKKHGHGMSSEQHRMFPTATEHCLFFMLGEQGFNNNADNYWEGWEPIRVWLSDERKLSGLTIDQCNSICNKQNMTQSAFTKGGFRLILEEDYNALRNATNGRYFVRDYDELKRDYDELKREFYATRAYFDNAHDNMTDVWGFGRVTGEERYGHATPKPVEMMQRVMRSSLATGGLCVEPFGGSGSTLMGAERTGRVCYSMELDPKYCDVIINRWQQYTGKEAVLESTGETFNSKISA